MKVPEDFSVGQDVGVQGSDTEDPDAVKARLMCVSLCLGLKKILKSKKIALAGVA